MPAETLPKPRLAFSPHAHSVALSEDACKTSGSASPRPSQRQTKALPALRRAYLPEVTSNGEVERPPRSVGSATRAHTAFSRPRRPPTYASRSLQRLLGVPPAGVSPFVVRVGDLGTNHPKKRSSRTFRSQLDLAGFTLGSGSGRRD